MGCPKAGNGTKSGIGTNRTALILLEVGECGLDKIKYPRMATLVATPVTITGERSLLENGISDFVLCLS
jgi:hypothetical protein